MPRMLAQLSVFALLSALMLTLTSVAQAQTTVDVHLVNFAFNPSPVNITQGDTIHWIWDTNFHSTTSVAGQSEQWDSDIHNSGFTFDHTFTQVGTFNYYCKIHGQDNGDGTASGMAGTITVSPVPAPSALLTALLGAVPGLALVRRRLRA